MKKLLALVLSLCMMLGCVSLVSAEGKIANVYYGGGTPMSIDPALNSAVNGMNILSCAFTGLMGYQLVDGEVQLACDLAESYTISEDQLTYTFVLKEGLKWSDGSDLLASEIQASWDRAGSAELGADYGFLFDYIERDENGKLNIVVDDEARTFTVKLVSPTLYFINLCGFPTFYPVKVELCDNDGIWATNPETYIGTGPFRMTSYQVDNVITFERNPYYWDAENVKLDGVNCWLSEDNTAILTAYENDNAVYIGSIDPEEYARLQETYPGELVFGPYIGTWYILFNVYKDLSPVNGKTLTVQEQSKARFALGQMINRQDLVDYVTMAGQQPATGFFPAGLSDGLNADVRTAEGYGSWYTGTATPSEINPDYTVDCVEALQTLIDLGYSYTGSIEGGDIVFTDFPSIEFAFNNSGANAAIMQYVQATWEQFGIIGVINQEAWSTLQVKLKKGDAESARMGWVADYNDTTNFLEIFISASGNNYPRLGRDIGDYTRATETTQDAGVGAYWGDGTQTWAEAYDALVDQIKATSDLNERAALCAEAEKVLMATGGVAPMYFYTNPYMCKSNVTGLVMNVLGGVYWNWADIVD